MKSHHSFFYAMTVNKLLIIEHYKVGDVCSGVLLLIFIPVHYLFMLYGNGRERLALPRGGGWSSSSAQCTRST